MLKLSKKFKKFLKYNDAVVEVLEGQTFAGKTTVGMVKFIMKCIASPKKNHGIAGLNLGVLEKNIINSEQGITANFGDDKAFLHYYPNGCAPTKLSHIRIVTSKGIKIIYVFGYDDKNKWQNALGGQLGCLFIDEINIADMEFVEEAWMRADYIMCTLNPDNPDLQVYQDYINHARPLPEYVESTPEEMMIQLMSQEAKPGWTHWYFTMDDNASASEEKKASIRSSVPLGSKRYKNKILGLRGRSEGLVFATFDRAKQVIPIEEFKYLPNERVYRVVIGLDSGLNKDATAAVPILLTTAGRMICMPSFYFLPKPGINANTKQAKYIERWLDYWFLRFGGAILANMAIVICDSAAVTQALLYEMQLYTHYDGMPVAKKDIQQDTQRAQGTVEKSGFVIVNAGYIDPVTFEKISDVDMFIVELENKVWDKRHPNVPEDGNDHCIDAFKYATYYIYYGG